MLPAGVIRRKNPNYTNEPTWDLKVSQIFRIVLEGLGRMGLEFV